MKIIPNGLSLLCEKDLSEHQKLELNLPQDATYLRGYWLADSAGQFVSGCWYQFVSLEQLRLENDQLSEFAQQILTNFDTHYIAWHSGTFTRADHQNEGLELLIKEFTLEDIKSFSKLYNSVLVIIKTGDDNLESIKIDKSFGLKSTGIRSPFAYTPSGPYIHLEYWYIIITP